jgi:bacillithiol biosynthesis cysteine-adding enzyme BshC
LAGGAAVVVAGQQPAPGLGPLYALAKAAASVSLARRHDALPLFWIAGDDHDLAEASRVSFLATGGALEHLRAPFAVPPGTSLNRLETDEALKDWVEGWRARLPDTPFRDPWFDALLEDCRGTWSDWMARSLLRLFGDRGLIVADPAWLRESASDLLARYAAQAAPLAGRMGVETGRLNAAGWKPGIDPLPACHLFETVVVDQKEGRRLRASPTADLPQRVKADPGRFSPDVALRPVLQDALFPVLAMVAGPGEIAYLAQLGPLYEALDVSRPPLFLRPPLTLLGPREARHLERWKLSPADALLPPEALLAKARAGPGLAGRIAALKPRWKADLEALGKPAVALDPALARAALKTSESLEAALDAFARKVAAAEDRAGGIDHAQAKALNQWVFPGGRPQERVLNAGSLLARFGQGLAMALVDGVDWADPAPRMAVIMAQDA